MGTKAVILVGGPTKGTRFRPISLSQHFVPKPLFPIAGLPMIRHHIEACALVPGLTEVLLLGFYEEGLFNEFIQTVSQSLKLPVRFLRETAGQQFGTAGSLFHFKEEILSGNPDNIFLFNCDICCDFPLVSMLSFHQKHKGQVTILGKKVSSEQANFYGCIATDPETKELMHYAEKPETFVSDLINCGIYCISPSFFNTLKEVKDTKELPIPNYFRLEHDVFPEISGKKAGFVFETTGFWSPIKTVGMAVVCSQFYMEKYKKTHPELLFGFQQKTGDQQPRIVGSVLIHPSSTVHPSAKIGPNVFISAGAKIGAGVRVANSIILDNAELKDHACVLYAVVGWNSSIGSWSRVEGVNDPSANNTQDSSNIGVSIIGEGVTIGNEVMVRRCVVLPHKEISTSYSNQIIL